MLQSATPAGSPAALRRTYKLLALTLTLLSLALALPAGASALMSIGGGWFPQTVGSTTQLRGVSFIDATHGWAVGDLGAILVTTNGGAAWSPQTSGGTAFLHGVTFIDANHGWAVGFENDPFNRSVILATANGGATWNVQDLGTSEAGLQAVAFGDATHGLAVGNGGLMLTTANGGATWSPYTMSGWSSKTFYGVAFGDATHGWVVGRYGTILATANGGSSWSPQTSGTTSDLTAVAFSDATHGWAVGDGGIILATTNGGSSWSPQTSGTTQGLLGVAFVPPSVPALGLSGSVDGALLSAILAGSGATHGWAVGDGGTILVTTDGGATWSPQTSGTTKNLFAVADGDASHVWAVGNDGVILATTTGGLTPASPTIASFTPTSGPVGTVVTVTGTGFAGATAVGFAPLRSAAFSVVSATQITATVPAGATTGRIAVTTPGGTGTSATSFTVTVPARPKMTTLKPASGKRGALVTITGTGFGAAQGNSSVRFGAKKCATYSSWSATRIKCRVPASAKYGKVSVTVTTGAGKSNALSFTVKR